jgi:hypothetical protein
MKNLEGSKPWVPAPDFLFLEKELLETLGQNLNN